MKKMAVYATMYCAWEMDAVQCKYVNIYIKCIPVTENTRTAEYSNAMMNIVILFRGFLLEKLNATAEYSNALMNIVILFLGFLLEKLNAKLLELD